MYSIEPIGYVSNSRNEILDDNWGNIISEIKISDKLSEKCLLGIDQYSHLEIIFYFHLADPSQINISSSRPRGNPEFPEVGIFAQRKKLRPNMLGATIVKLISLKKNIVVVSGLDAVNGTPVIDIKPVLEEFLPGEKLKQPDWSHILMKDYWKK